MLTLPSTVQVFIAIDPVDLRKGFEGLSGLVRSVMKQDPLSGHLFCFINRRKDRAKMLFWDRNKYWIFYTRLERGTFKMPKQTEAMSVAIDPVELSLLLEGIDLQGASRRPRWRAKQLPAQSAGQIAETVSRT